jgi:excisionase family DNA binding protein
MENRMSAVMTGHSQTLARVTDVARFLSISRSKVYAMMDSGQLPYVKLGKSRRVRWPDVLKLVTENLVGCDTK